MQLSIGLDAISSYRRLSYTPWHAIAEFVDNSTQAYFDNRDLLEQAFESDGKRLKVNIIYERQKDDFGGILRIVDNSIGMSYEELDHAMHVALPPDNPTGRSRYGMGLKTAACWIGKLWTVKTKKLGETIEHTVTVDVNRIARGDADLQYQSIEGKDPDLHYTIVEIADHNQKFQGRTLGKIKEFLRSMYRVDLGEGYLTLEWRGQQLEWKGMQDELLRARDGSIYRKKFNFKVNGKSVHGWVGILERGSRSKAGFSILHSRRVVRGWPDSWRPTTLYGQFQGSNDLVNQRLLGEINLDDFDVSHTKDDIIWLGDELDLVEERLKEHCGEYREIALQHRKGADDQRGPSEADTDVAVDELQRELESPEMVDHIAIEDVPAPELTEETFSNIVDSIDHRDETFSATVNNLRIKGYLAHDLSPNDPYVTVDAAKESEVIVIINMQHPHLRYIDGNKGLLNYFRHCTYDAIAEWKALHRATEINPDTVKLIKDRLLRVSFELDMKQYEAEGKVIA